MKNFIIDDLLIEKIADIIDNNIYGDQYGTSVDSGQAAYEILQLIRREKENKDD